MYLCVWCIFLLLSVNGIGPIGALCRNNLVSLIQFISLYWTKLG